MQSSITPKVSVIIPVYNGIKNGLENCLISLDQQTYTNLEILVVDDCSQDSSATFVEEFALNSCKHIQLFKHKKNTGLSSSWNDGITKSNGNFVLLIQQDCSLAENNTLEMGIKEIIERDLGILMGVPVYDSQAVNYFQEIFEFRTSRLLDATNQNFFSANKCDLVRRGDLQKIGEFTTKLSQIGQDWKFALRANELGVPIGVSKVFSYRNQMVGEDSFGKILKKEYHYSKQLAKILINAGVSTKIVGSGTIGQTNFKNRLFNIMFPLFFDISIIAWIFIGGLSLLFLSMAILFIWGLYGSALFFLRVGKEYQSLKHALVYLFVSFALDEVYLSGALIGIFHIAE